MSFLKNIANSINSVDKSKGVAALTGIYTGGTAGFIALGIASGLGVPSSVALAVTSMKSGRLVGSTLAGKYFENKAEKVLDYNKKSQALNDSKAFFDDAKNEFINLFIDSFNNENISNIKQIFDNAKDLRDAAKGDTCGEKLSNLMKETPKVFAKQFDDADIIGMKDLANQVLNEEKLNEINTELEQHNQKEDLEKEKQQIEERMNDDEYDRLSGSEKKANEERLNEINSKLESSQEEFKENIEENDDLIADENKKQEAEENVEDDDLIDDSYKEYEIEKNAEEDEDTI